MSQAALIKVTDVARKLNVNRATVYKILARDPNFPAPIHVAPRTPRWRPDEIESWLAHRQGNPLPVSTACAA